MIKGWTRTIYKNSAFLAVADAASKGATVVVILLIARFLGPAIYGQYATAAAVSDLFLIITGIGFEQEFTRRGGKQKDTIPTGFVLNLLAVSVTAVLAYLGIVLFLSLGIYSRETMVVGIILGGALIAKRFHLPFRHLYLLLSKTNVTTLVQGVSTLVIVSLTLVIILINGNLLPIVFAQLFVALGTLGIWFWITPKHYLPGLPSLQQLGQFFKDSIPFALSNIIWVVYFNFDVFLLSLFRPESEVGIYAGVYRIIGINYILGYAIANTFTPLLFEKYTTNKTAYRDVTRQLVKSMAGVGVLMSLGLFLGAGILIPAIIGKEFVDGVIIGRILSVAVLFRLLNFGLTEILTTSDRQMIRVTLEATTVGVNIGLNLLLIPYYGGVGAAIATVVAELILCLGSFYISYRNGLISFFRPVAT